MHRMAIGCVSLAVFFIAAGFQLRCFLLHRSHWRTRHGIMRECIKCDTLTIIS
jgi:hypothetical protein